MFYFLSTVVDPPIVIYVGKDKHENEELLKWGFPEDVWFHVDKLSSAHVYLRLPKGMLVDSIPEPVLIDCAQLVKANSIQGSKMNNVAVVYTPFTNLKKTASMEVGQVGFHSQRKVSTIKVEKRLTDVVNRLNKTREEKYPNLQEQREQRDREDQAELRLQREEKHQLEQEERERTKAEEEVRSYKAIMKEDNMESNQYSEDVDYKAVEDDFM